MRGLCARESRERERERERENTRLTASESIMHVTKPTREHTGHWAKEKNAS